MSPFGKVKIYAHVLVFGSIFGVSTLGMYAYSYMYARSEEDQLKYLREKYAVQIKKREEQTHHMQAFFDQLARKDPELDDKLHDILSAGKRSSLKRTRNTKLDKTELPTTVKNGLQIDTDNKESKM